VSSLPFLSIAIANFVFDWGLYMFEIVIPVYLHEMLEMDMRQVGTRHNAGIPLNRSYSS
jgi:hypothetical protein